MATNALLRLSEAAAGLKIIPIGESGTSGLVKRIDFARWSEDSSRLIVVYDKAADVLDRSGARVGSVHLPKRPYVNDGWFRPRTLILYLSPHDQERIGWVLQCVVAKPTCNRIASQVDSVSIGGRGIVGTMGPLGKIDEPTDDAITIYPRYAAEIPHSSCWRDKCTLRRASATFSKINISPLRTKAIVTWALRPSTARCTPSNPQASYCWEGIVVDLSKLVK